MEQQARSFCQEDYKSNARREQIYARQEQIWQELFASQLRSEKQVMVYDMIGFESRKRNHAGDLVQWASDLTAAYLCIRIAYENLPQKYLLVEHMEAIYDDGAIVAGQPATESAAGETAASSVSSQPAAKVRRCWRKDTLKTIDPETKALRMRFARHLPRIAAQRGARELYALSHSVSQERQGAFPWMLQRMLNRAQTFATCIGFGQYATTVPLGLECADLLWERHWQDRGDSSFHRALYLVGKSRSRVLQSHLLSLPALEEDKDIMTFRRTFRAKLDDVELTHELKTLPADIDVRNSRLTEQLESAAWKNWQRRLTTETCYLTMVESTCAIWGNAWYVAKNICNMIAEGSHAAAEKWSFRPWPWILDDYFRVHDGPAKNKPPTLACDVVVAGETAADGDAHRKEEEAGNPPTLACDAEEEVGEGPAEDVAVAGEAAADGDAHRKEDEAGSMKAALGPNPTIFCNLVRGRGGKTGRNKHCSKETHRTFNSIAEQVLLRMPSRVRFKTNAGPGWLEVEVPDVFLQPSFRAYGLLQLNMCKLVQVLDFWFSGNLPNPRRMRQPWSSLCMEENISQKSCMRNGKAIPSNYRVHIYM